MKMREGRNGETRRINTREHKGVIAVCMRRNKRESKVMSRKALLEVNGISQARDVSESIKMKEN